LREQLDDDKTVADNVSDGSETVHVGGQARHVIGYLQDFLFAPERTRTAVRFLSGGERQRVLLARLFAKPANVIVLDEPTNDLDAETLELLEERLVEFSGTVLVVSHDRAFLDNVVTSTLVFEPAAAGDRNPTAWMIREYVGGYADWLRQRPAAVPERKPERQAAPAAASSSSAVPSRPRKLSFKEQQELAGLPARIEALETEITARHAAMAHPDYYRQPGEVLSREQGLLAKAEAELAEAFVRWESLEGPGA
jgi:ATP-binding cassette subfamily F protein uup